MSPRLLWAPALTALLLTVCPAWAAAPPSRVRPATAQEVQALADQIDRLIAQRWDKTKAQPAPQADDSEFLRRVYLDLAGRIPTAAEARSFLKDKRADRR